MRNTSPPVSALPAPAERRVPVNLIALLSVLGLLGGGASGLGVVRSAVVPEEQVRAIAGQAASAAIVPLASKAELSAESAARVAGDGKLAVRFTRIEARLTELVEATRQQTELLRELLSARGMLPSQGRAPQRGGR